MIKFKVAHSFTGTGLGYQTSIYVLLKSLSLHYGYDICCNEYDFHNLKFTFSNVNFDCPAKADSEFAHILDVTGMTFTDIIAAGLQDDTLLHGYPTLNPDYDLFDTIKNEFVFREEITKKCLHFLSNFKDQEIISLHVRRGDYTHDCAGGLFICGEDYYKNALEQFDSNAKVFIFTNEKDYVRSCDTFKDDRFILITDLYNDNIEFDNELCKEIDYELDFSGSHRFYYKYAIARIADKYNLSIAEVLGKLPRKFLEKFRNSLYNMSFDLCLISMCKKHIISNSIFGLWGLVLSETTAVVYPKYWMHQHEAYDPNKKLIVLKDLGEYDQTREFLGTLYRPHWIGLENPNARPIPV